MPVRWRSPRCPLAASVYCRHCRRGNARHRAVAVLQLAAPCSRSGNPSWAHGSRAALPYRGPSACQHGSLGAPRHVPGAPQAFCGRRIPRRPARLPNQP